MTDISTVKLKQILVYGVSFLLILGGLGGVLEGGLGFLSGPIFIITGLFLLPTTRPFVTDAVNSVGGPDLSTIGRGTFVVIIIVGILLGGALLPAAESPSANGIDSPTSPSNSTDSPDSSEPSQSDSDSSSDGSSSSDSPDDSTDSGPETSWTVTVLSVTDGDTMDVRMPDGSTETIRLLGVDTPETSAGSTDPAEWEDIPGNSDGREWLANWGGQASDYAEERLAGQEIYIEVDKQSDRRGTYDRLLVYAYQSESSSKSFNKRLLENGYARMYDSQFTKRSEYQLAEFTARNNDVGIWDYIETSSSTSSSDGQDGDLEVSNIHAEATGNDHENLNGEYIELTNEGSSSIDMSRWTLADDADHTFYFPSGFELDADESVTIYTGSGTNSNSELYWGSGRAIWNNTGDTIIVTNDSGETVINREY